MAAIVRRLWNLSPASLTDAMARRWGRWRTRPAWHRVQAGPLAGRELYFAEPIEGGYREMVAGTFDRFIHEELGRRIDLRNCACWDVGGHFGYHSLALAAQGAKVVAFEPHAENARRFTMNRERNSDLTAAIEIRETALSNRSGEAAFVASDDLKGMSSGSHLQEALPPEAAGVYEQFQETRVATVRGDDLIAAGLPAPKVMKLDVEGAELLVLEGCAQMFREARPLLFVEVHHILLMHGLHEWAGEMGYRLRPLDEEHASPSRCFMLGEPA